MNEKILIVEDDFISAKLFRHILQHYGYSDILETAHGEEVYCLAQKYQPALIVMDIKLSGISGIEAMKTLRLDLRLQHIPIIAVSALSFPHEIQEIKAAGCNAYLSKPFSVNDFISNVQKFIDDDHAC